MSRPVPAGAGRPSLRRTVLAFLLAPGIAAAAGGFLCALSAVASAPIVRGGPFGACGPVGEAVLGVVFLTVLFVFYLGSAGYVTACVVSAPLYGILPAQVRAHPAAVVVLAGGSAAAPWLALSPFAGVAVLLGGVFAFPLGCVAGVAFVLIRGRVRPADRP